MTTPRLLLTAALLVPALAWAGKTAVPSTGRTVPAGDWLEVTIEKTARRVPASVYNDKAKTSAETYVFKKLDAYDGATVYELTLPKTYTIMEHAGQRMFHHGDEMPSAAPPKSPPTPKIVVVNSAGEWKDIKASRERMKEMY